MDTPLGLDCTVVDGKFGGQKQLIVTTEKRYRGFAIAFIWSIISGWSHTSGMKRGEKSKTPTLAHAQYVERTLAK